MTDVYTDGACKGNPGPGGWGWVVPGGPWANGAETESTNQRMELMAAFDALSILSGPVRVISDSTYLVHCFRDRWWEGWLARGWKNSQRQPVANRDIWEPLIELYRSRDHEISFQWVKGHDGNEWNEVADRLAVEAAETQTGRRGEGFPPDLGEGDRNGSGEESLLSVLPAVPTPAADGSYGSTWRPAGRAVVVLGLQPTGLGGYDERAISGRVRGRLAEILSAKLALDPDLVVLTGLRLGAETLAAEAAAEIGAPYVAVLPFPDPDARWPESSRRTFAELLAAAALVVQLERKAPATPQRAGQSLDRRNAWLRKVADEAVIVWDRRERRVGELVRAFEQDMPDDVWILEP